MRVSVHVKYLKKLLLSYQQWWGNFNNYMTLRLLELQKHFNSKPFWMPTNHSQPSQSKTSLIQKKKTYRKLSFAESAFNLVNRKWNTTSIAFLFGTENMSLFGLKQIEKNTMKNRRKKGRRALEKGSKKLIYSQYIKMKVYVIVTAWYKVQYAW